MVRGSAPATTHRAGDPPQNNFNVPGAGVEAFVPVDSDQPLMPQLYAHAKTLKLSGEDGRLAPLFRNIKDVTTPAASAAEA